MLMVWLFFWEMEVEGRGGRGEGVLGMDYSLFFFFGRGGSAFGMEADSSSTTRGGFLSMKAMKQTFMCGFCRLLGYGN